MVQELCPHGDNKVCTLYQISRNILNFAVRRSHALPRRSIRLPLGRRVSSGGATLCKRQRREIHGKTTSTHEALLTLGIHGARASRLSRYEKDHS